MIKRSQLSGIIFLYFISNSVSLIFKILLNKYQEYKYDLMSTTIKASDKSCTISKIMYLIRLVDKFCKTGVHTQFVMSVCVVWSHICMWKKNV